MLVKRRSLSVNDVAIVRTIWPQNEDWPRSRASTKRSIILPPSSPPILLGGQLQYTAAVVEPASGSQEGDTESGKRENSVEASIAETADHLGLWLYFVILSCFGLTFAVVEVIDKIKYKVGYSVIYSFKILTDGSSVIMLLLMNIDIALHRRRCIRAAETASGMIIPKMEEGLNFLLRIGVIVFSMGGVVLSVIIITYKAVYKVNPPAVVWGIFNITFIMLQSYFLFKHHRLVLSRRPRLMRFILMHLIGVNVCHWFSTASHEAQVLFDVSHHGSNNTSSSNGASNSTSEEKVLGLNFKNIKTSSQLYLSPCVIEYAVLSAGALTNMYRRVGSTPHAGDEVEVTSNSQPQEIEMSLPEEEVDNSTAETIDSETTSTSNTYHVCDKSNTGLFFSVLLCAVFIVYYVCFVLLKSNQKMLIPLRAFSIGIVVIGIAVVIALSYRMFKTLIISFHHDLFIDRFLMNISFYAKIIFSIFILIADCYYLSKGYVYVEEVIMISLNLLEMLQYMSQTIFILVGINLRTTKALSEANLKPGNTLLMILLSMNFLSWIDQSLSLGTTIINKRYVNFFGATTWFLLNGICKPLMVFYRFHSAAMLAEMWVNVYKPVKLSVK